MKYIIQCWGKDLETKQANNLFCAVYEKKKLKRDQPESYCCIIKVPFRKRHPNFPLYFSAISIFLLIVAPELGSCIHRILQIMQLWK